MASRDLCLGLPRVALVHYASKGKKNARLSAPPSPKKPGAMGKPQHTDQLLTSNPVVDMEQRLMG